MINLMFKAALDATGFHKGLLGITDASKKAGDVAGREIGKDFTKSLKRTIGAAAVIGGIASQFMDARRITDMASASGMTAQEFAALEYITDRLGDTSEMTTEQIDGLVKSVIDSGQIPSDNVFAAMAGQANLATSAINKLKAGTSSVIGNFIAMRGSILRGFAASSESEQARKSAIERGLSQAEVDKIAKKAYANALSREYQIDFGRAAEADPLAGHGKIRESKADKRRKQDEELFGSVMDQQDELDRYIEKLRSESRDKAMSVKIPQAQKGLGELASMGLGNARGSFGIERQMLDEQKKAVQLLRDQKRILDKKL